MKVKMNMKEIIAAINGTTEFIEKGYPLTYSVRRAIRKNIPVLTAEYSIFDAERKKMMNEADDTEQVVYEEIVKIMEQKVEIDIEKVQESELKNVEIPYLDELTIDYMLLWPDDEPRDEPTKEEVKSDERSE